MARYSVAFFRFANSRVYLCSCKDLIPLKFFAHRTFRITQSPSRVKINYPRPLVVTSTLTFLGFLPRVQPVLMI